MSEPSAGKPARLRDQTFSLLGYTTVSYAIRLGSSVVVARLLGPEMMGWWLLLSLFPSWAEAFARLKVDLSAVYFIGQKRTTFPEAAGAIHVVAIVTGGGAAALLLLAEPWIFPRLFDAGTVSPWAYRFVVATIPMHFIAMNFAYLMLQREDVKGYNESSLLRSITPSVLASTLLLVTPLRIGAVVVGFVAGTAIAVVYGAVRLHHIRPEWPRDRTLWGQLIRHSRGMYGGGLVEQLNQYVSSLLLGGYLRPSDLTFFRVGQDRLQLLDQVPTALTTILYPRIANSSDDQSRQSLVARSCRVLILLLVPVGLVGAVLTPSIVWALYGREFAPVSHSVWLLLPGVIALGVTQPLVQFFMGSGRTDLAWRMPLAPLALQLALIIPLMQLWGFQGAAVTLSAAFVLHAIIRIAVFSKLTGQPVGAVIGVNRADVETVRHFLKELLGRLRQPLRKLIPAPTRGR